MSLNKFLQFKTDQSCKKRYSNLSFEFSSGLANDI